MNIDITTANNITAIGPIDLPALRIKLRQAKEDLAKVKSYANAVALQKLQREFKELIKTNRKCIKLAYDGDSQ